MHVKYNSLDDALDDLYATMDYLMWHGHIRAIDYLFYDLRIQLRETDKFDIDIALGYLVSSFPVADKLLFRSWYIKELEEYLNKHSLMEDGLLEGLY